MYPVDLTKTKRPTPRMDRQIERILAVLKDAPMTVPQIAKAVFVGSPCAGNYIRLLRKAKRVYVCGWMPTASNKPTAIYAAGNLPDVKYVTKQPKRGDTRVKSAKARMLSLLVLPQTVEQLAERSGFSRSRTRFYIHALRQEKKIHIKHWKLPEFAGQQAAVYALGNKPDMVRVRRAKQKAKAANKKARAQTSKRIATGIFSALGL